MTDDDADAKARATAHALIQGYLGPDHKVIDFFSALVQGRRCVHYMRFTGQSDEATQS